MLFEAFQLDGHVDNAMCIEEVCKLAPTMATKYSKSKLKWKINICTCVGFWLELKPIEHSIVGNVGRKVTMERIALTSNQRMASKRPKILLKTRSPKRSQSVRHCGVYTTIKSTVILITITNIRRLVMTQGTFCL